LLTAICSVVIAPETRTRPGKPAMTPASVQIGFALSLCLCASTLLSSTVGSSLGVHFQSNSNTISGHVSDAGRAPLPDLRVELLNEVDTVIQTVKTNGSGLFVFRKLSDGTFQVRVQTAGTNYVSQTKRVDDFKRHPSSCKNRTSEQRVSPS
jgi:hypothetical protein